MLEKKKIDVHQIWSNTDDQSIDREQLSENLQLALSIRSRSSSQQSGPRSKLSTTGSAAEMSVVDNPLGGGASQSTIASSAARTLPLPVVQTVSGVR